ncbi:SRPBCC family protein [Saccharothrix sp. NPDC042600]|uniref:SRPBCC family protein n=1 Tax=Saccharothrix TaxID=2071 RepID=UPI00340E250D|nr:hypothetical protein GCM10017745_87630 [Saccharothrix mutabilis subsp. capreolus]
MENFTIEHSVEGPATVAAVWALWSDVGRWAEWDADVESVSLDGAFDVGGKGRMVVAGQPPIAFELTEVVPFKGFTDETAFGGAVLRFEHLVEEVAAGVRVTHRVVVEGGAAERIGAVVGRGVPGAVERLVALASSSG